MRFSRQVIRGLLAPFGSDFVEAAVILTDELVANAIRHGQPPIVLDVKGNEQRLTVAVTDGGGGRPVQTVVDPLAESGRGLTIVDQLADDWGVRDLPQGKCVWFELEIKETSGT